MIDLEEIPTSKLTSELYRRKQAIEAGQCYYCGRPLNTHDCKLKSQVDHESNRTALLEIKVLAES